MARNTRTKFEVDSDRAKISKMYMGGMTQAAIAADLGMTQQMVSYDIRAVQAQWREGAIGDIGELRGRELARIDRMEKEYWEAWEKSKEETTKARRSMKGESVVASSIERATTAGNPAYLSGVQWCVSERCRILGLYQPTGRVISVNETTDADGHKQLDAFDLTVLDANQLRDYLAIVRAMKSGQNEDAQIVDGRVIE